jgi:hypothetical protein
MSFQKYHIFCVSGSGGSFLSTVFAKLLGIHITPKLSIDGNCHDLGNGEWEDTDEINLIGNHWRRFNIKKTIFVSHLLVDLEKHKKMYPEVGTVLLAYDQTDYLNITKLNVTKFLHSIWNENEYNKLVGPSWPPYDRNNIKQSSIIYKDLTKLLNTHTKQWIEDIDPVKFDFVIDFKTVMGLNEIRLDQAVANIVGKSTNSDIYNYVVDYQLLNKELYFKNAEII